MSDDNGKCECSAHDCHREAVDASGLCGRCRRQHSAPEPGSLSASLGGDDTRTTAQELSEQRLSRGDLDALEALAATVDSWVAVGNGVFIEDAEVFPEGPAPDAWIATCCGDSEATAIAAFASAVPALIAEVARLKSVIVEFESVRSSLEQNSATKEDELRAKIEALADGWRADVVRWRAMQGPSDDADMLDQCAQEVRALLDGAP